MPIFGSTKHVCLPSLRQYGFSSTVFSEKGYQNKILHGHFVQNHVVDDALAKKESLFDKNNTKSTTRSNELCKFVIWRD